MSHYLKIIMDGLFGENNFRNEVVWCYRTGGATKRWYAKKHDVILYYARERSTLFCSCQRKSLI